MWRQRKTILVLCCFRLTVYCATHLRVISAFRALKHGWCSHLNHVKSLNGLFKMYLQVYTPESHLSFKRTALGVQPVTKHKGANTAVYEELPKSSLATGLTVSREVHSGNTATINDCFSESFITADMFEVSAHACFHNKASISVHQFTVIKALQPKFCFSNPNRLTVFTNLLRWNDTKTLCNSINYYTGKRLFHFSDWWSSDAQWITGEFCVGCQIWRTPGITQNTWPTTRQQRRDFSSSMSARTSDGAAGISSTPECRHTSGLSTALSGGRDPLAVHFPVGHFLDEQHK